MVSFSVISVTSHGFVSVIGVASCFTCIAPADHRGDFFGAGKRLAGARKSSDKGN
jgi:hypothetical protein